MSHPINSPQQLVDQVRRLHGPLSCKLGSSTKHPRPARKEKLWRGVFFEGPEPAQDHEGEEVPVWFVYVGDEAADPLGKIYQCYSFALAEQLARRMARDRHLELISEAMPA